MKQSLIGIYRLCVMFGIDPRRMLHSMRGIPDYLRNLRELQRQRANSARPFPFARPYPCLGDRYSDSGSIRGHYFHQDLLVASRIHDNAPQRHVDIGSRIDGFVAHVASFRPIEVIDIRPLTGEIHNVTFTQADLMSPLPETLVDYCDSLSCLHAIEHFGLGRYGDLVNHDGYLLGLDNLHRLLKPGGRLYLSVPIGPQRIEFDAHRVFSVAYLLELFDGKYHLERFSFIDDDSRLHEEVTMTASDIAHDFGCDYGCGIFELTKR